MFCVYFFHYNNLFYRSLCVPQAARFLGVDIDDGQLQKASDNIKFAELGNRIHLLKASSMCRKHAQQFIKTFNFGFKL